MKNLLYMLLILAAGGFASCSDDDTERVAAGGVGVYFAIDIDSDITLEKGQSSFTIPILRTDTGSDFDLLIVNLLGDNTPTTLFTFPDEVHFAAGESVAYYEIGVKSSQLVADQGYEFTLTLSDADNLSPYGHESQEFVVTYAPWDYLGEGYYRDDILSSLFTLSYPNREGVVKVYESQLTKGLYRIEEPFSAEFVGPMFGVTADDLGLYGINCTTRKEYIYFNATDPDKVYIPLVNGSVPSVGVNWGEGELGIISYVDSNKITFPSTNYGKLKNGVVTFPQRSILLCLDGEAYGYYLNASGMFRILMPGTSQLEPVVTVNYKGILTDADDISSALFNVTKNVDAAGYYWTVFEDYLDTDEVQEKADAMFAGEIEAEKGISSGDVSYVVDTPGEYTAVFVPYSEELLTGEPVAVNFEFTMGSGVVPADFEATFSVSAEETIAEIGVVPNADNLLYYYSFMTQSDYDEILAMEGVTSINDYDVLFFDYVAEEYGLSVSGVIDMLTAKGAVSATYEELTPGETYVVYAYCINRSTGVARSKISVDTFETATPANLEADYSAWIGTWTATTASSWGLTDSGYVTGGPKTFEFTVALKRPNESFYIYNWDDGSVSWPAEALYATVSEDDEKPCFQVFSEQNLGTLEGNFVQLCAYASVPGYNWPFITGSYVALVGDISEDGNTATITGNEIKITVNKEQTTCTIAGMAYLWVTADDEVADIFTNTATFGVGPYSLTKKAEEATSSVKSSMKNRFAADRRNRLFENTPKAVRSRLVSTYNCVEAR